MSNVTRDGASDIVQKLEQQAPAKPGRTKFEVTHREGRDHEIIAVAYGGLRIGQFGINRGSRHDAGHHWVAKALLMPQRKAYDFSTCKLTVDDYIELLMDKRQIPDDRPPKPVGANE